MLRNLLIFMLTIFRTLLIPDASILSCHVINVGLILQNKLLIFSIVFICWLNVYKAQQSAHKALYIEIFRLNLFQPSKQNLCLLRVYL